MLKRILAFASIVDLDLARRAARHASAMTMSNATFLQVLAFVLALSPIGVVSAQATAPATTGVATSPAADKKIAIDLLKGNWVRPDGGYTIAIKSVNPNGQLEAMYFNPNQLPFAKAQASLEGATLRASFELRAGGYDGSTYELTYDPATDRLKGIYYQAVMKQKFDVFFVRK